MPSRVLGRAATDVALSPDVACVAVSESGEQEDLDLDGDLDDAVLFAGAPTALVGGAVLENTRIPVLKLGALGTRCVVIVPDDGTGVLAFYDHATRGVVNTGQAAEDFVLGPERSLVAFRTPEVQQGLDLNGDDVLDAAPTDGGLLATVRANLPSQWDPDSIISPAEGAEFNARLCGEYGQENTDNSKGVHNPFLCQALLVASQAEVRAAYGLAPPSAAVQAILNEPIGGRYAANMKVSRTQIPGYEVTRPGTYK